MQNIKEKESHKREIELLFACTRTELDESNINGINKYIQEKIDWEYLLNKALENRIESLLYINLKKINTEVIPEKIINYLQVYFYKSTHKNLFLTQELLNILKILAKQNISAIPFKGPVLGFTLYGNLSLRRFSDLDIIVHKEDILKVKNILISQGFRAYPNLTGKAEEIYIETQLGYNFVRDDGTIIEMHWKPIPKMFNFPISSEQLWQELESVSLAGTTVLVPNPEMLLLILCAHGSKDRWAQLKWICDLAELLRSRQDIDWQKVIKQAKNLGCLRRLFLGLSLAHKFLNAPIPSDILQKIESDKAVLSLENQVTQWLFPEEYSNNRFLAATRFQIGVLEKISDKFLFLFYFIITPISKEDWIEQTKPNSSLFNLPFSLRHPLRLLRGLVRRDTTKNSLIVE